MPSQSRLEQELPMPGVVVPKYRYKTYWLTYDMGMVTGPVSAGGGSMALVELTTGGLASLEFDAATDDHNMLIGLPNDCDVNAPIDLRVVWSSDQTTVADSYTWTVLRREVDMNSTTGFNTAPTAALDTTIAADTNLVTANAAQYTAWGTIAAETLTGTEPDYLLHLLIDPTLGGTISADVVLVWAVQIRYMPKLV